MKPVSLADITFEQGLQLLSLRKQGLDSGKIRRMSKEAMDNAYPLQAVGTQMIEAVKEAGRIEDFKNSISDGLSSAGSSLQDGFNGVKGGVQSWWGGLNKPTQSTLTHGAIGAGLGAASGAGASFMGDGRHYGRNMLMGGVAGGAIGGGLGIARNPEIAESLREKFEGMLSKEEPEEPDAPPKPEATPGATPAKAPEPSLGERIGLPQVPPKLTPEQLETKADRINALSKGPKEVEINKDRDTLEGSPNRNANLLHAANAGATAFVGKKLSDPAGHSVGTMAQTLKGMPGIGDKNPVRPSLQPSAIKAHLGGYDPSLLTDPSLIQKKSVPEIARLLRKNPELRSTLLGNARNPEAVAALMGQAPGGSKLVPGATRSGFGWRRPFRGAGLLGLLGMSAYGAAHTEAGRAVGNATHENAKALLDVLTARALKDKK